MFHTYFRFLRHSFFFGIVGMDNGVIVSLKGSDSVIKHSIDQFGIGRSSYSPGNR